MQFSYVFVHRIEGLLVNISQLHHVDAFSYNKHQVNALLWIIELPNRLVVLYVDEEMILSYKYIEISIVNYVSDHQHLHMQDLNSIMHHKQKRSHLNTVYSIHILFLHQYNLNAVKAGVSIQDDKTSYTAALRIQYKDL